MPLNEKGQEIPDPTPVAIPVGFQKPESLEEKMRRMIRSEAVAAFARAQGAETFDEANDFDVGDDYDPKSPWEYEIDQEAQDARIVRDGYPPEKSSPVDPGGPREGVSAVTKGDGGNGGSPSKSLDAAS